MGNAVRDPTPPGRLARRERPSGGDDVPRLRGWIHFVAALVALPAGVALTVRAAADHAGWPVAIYSVAMVVLFAVSSSYHVVTMPARTRAMMRRADHATIFVFIAACYTPWCALVVRGTLGVVVLGIAWAGAAVGVAGKLAGFTRFRPLTGALYLVLGWVGIVTLPDAFAVLSPAELGLTFSLGLLYTAGAAVLYYRRPDPLPSTFGYHEVWHSMVVGGAGCYWLMVWDLVARAR